MNSNTRSSCATILHKTTDRFSTFHTNQDYIHKFISTAKRRKTLCIHFIFHSLQKKAGTTELSMYTNSHLNHWNWHFFAYRSGKSAELSSLHQFGTHQQTHLITEAPPFEPVYNFPLEENATLSGRMGAKHTQRRTGGKRLRGLSCEAEKQQTTAKRR